MGRPKTCNPCCAGGGGSSDSSSSSFSSISVPGGCPGASPHCSVMPAQWNVQIPGLSDNNCTNCAQFASVIITEVTAYHGTSCPTCQWDNCNALSASPSCNCRQSSCDWIVRGTILTAGFQVVVTHYGGYGTETYRLALASVDCLGANTLPRISSGNTGCSGWPSSIIVSPA